MQSISADSLLTMSGNQLDGLYRDSQAGTIPDGACDGVALLAPGTRAGEFLAVVIRRAFWQGKVFDATRGELLNRITAFGVLAVRAKVYLGTSRFDGQQSIILDYSRTSWLARWVRDEIREVEPGLYLGFAHVFRIPVIRFALTAPSAPRTR